MRRQNVRPDACYGLGDASAILGLEPAELQTMIDYGVIRPQRVAGTVTGVLGRRLIAYLRRHNRRRLHHDVRIAPPRAEQTGRRYGFDDLKDQRRREKAPQRRDRIERDKT
jgi:hypothetical protein